MIFSDSDDPRRQPPPPPRKAGAPRGNKNAWKHGFYSHLFTREEALALSRPVKGQMQDEINLFKVLIDRVACQLNSADQQPLSFKEHVLALHVVTMAIARMNSFYHTNKWFFVDKDEHIQEFSQRLG